MTAHPPGTPDSTLKNRWLTALSALALLIPCGSFAIIGDAPIYLPIAATVLAVSVLLPRGSETTTRAIVYALTISAILAIVFNETYPLDTERFFFPLIEVMFPFVISLGVCATFFKQTQTTIASVVSMATFAMMIQGSCVYEFTNTRVVIDSSLWNNRFWLYGFFLVFELAVFFPLLHWSEQHGRQTRAPAQTSTFGRKKQVYGFAVLAVLILAVSLCRLAVQLERIMEPTYRRVLNMYFDYYKPKVVWGGEVDLRRKSSKLVRENWNLIVLRARGERAPGYLRGRIYERYRTGSWKGSQTEQQLQLFSEQADVASNRFYNGSEEPKIADLRRIDVLPAKRFYSDVLVATDRTRAVELIADGVTMDSNGQMQPQGWDATGAYSLFELTSGPSIQPPREQVDDKIYTQVPDALGDILAPYLAAYSGSSIDRIRQVERFLSENYSYELGVPFSGENDPIQEFLNEKKRGHCEYFATAAVLMLRAQGIPARYVTGFVCIEQHPNSGYWISRLGDCHAWAEAYDAESGAWITVEATPASGIPEGQDRTSVVQNLWEHPLVMLQNLYAQIKRGYFAEAVLVILADVWQVLLTIFGRESAYSGWLITALLVFGFLYLRQRRIARKNAETPVHIRHLRRCFDKVERHLERWHIIRTDVMSIDDLLDAARRNDVPEGPALSQLLNQYQALRYCPTPPSATDIASFDKDVDAFLAATRRQSR